MIKEVRPSDEPHGTIQGCPDPSLSVCTLSDYFRKQTLRRKAVLFSAFFAVCKNAAKEEKEWSFTLLCKTRGCHTLRDEIYSAYTTWSRLAAS